MPETLSVTSTPDASGFVTFDSASMNFQIETADMAHIDVYQVTVTATIPIETAPGSGVYMSDSFAFSIYVRDACDTTTLSFDPAVSDMLAYVNQGAETQ